jgi:3-methyl-2-oxobutanoate hydroxymethyltransferase
MVVYGMDSTLEVSLDIMKAHGKAVVRHSKQALVVVDMPFGSYQASPEDAFKNAADIIKHTGCAAVKLEGGKEMAETIHFLTQRGIPVMAHVGLMPQHVHTMGGYKFQGRNAAQAKKITEDAIAVQEAGAFSIVLEGVESHLAEKITHKLSIPTIGIGASPACDGQVLVIDDMLGLFDDFTPKFVKRYAEIGKNITAAVKAYAEDVKNRRFPGKEHCFVAKE